MFTNQSKIVNFESDSTFLQTIAAVSCSSDVAMFVRFLVDRLAGPCMRLVHGVVHGLGVCRTWGVCLLFRS